MAKRSKISREKVSSENRAFHLSGQITGSQTGHGLPGLRVEAFDRDLRMEQSLGAAITDEQGRYVIMYYSDQFARAEKTGADLFIRVFDGENRQLGESDVLFNAPADAAINLEVEPIREAGHSEYERYLAEILPLLEGQEVDLHELEEKDFAFLNKETGIDLGHIRLLSLAERLSREADIEAEACYGLWRKGMPVQLQELRRHSLEEMRVALEAAIEKNIIPARLRDSLDRIMERLRRLKTEQIPIVELAESVGLELPAALFDYFSAKSIRTLVDIRNVGGLAHIEGLPVEPGHPAVLTLEAHAQLSVLPTELAINARLIEAGYTGLHQVAETPQKSFVAAVEDRLSEDEAIAVHAAAYVQSRFLTNVLTGLRVNPSNGRYMSVRSSIYEVIPKVCGCDDCKRADSPVAYLADLLDYAIRRLKHNGNSVTLTFLQNHFHQPFRNLPLTCELMKQKVRQVRICIEVLREHLPTQYATYTPQWYLEAAYKILLEQIGTSFDELRQAQRLKKRERERLADRLGLVLNPQRSLPNDPDQLDLLFLDTDPNSPANPIWPVKLTEQSLEWLFGLRDTTRPPLDPDSQPEVLNWRMAYLYLNWHKADRSSNSPLGENPIIDPDVIGYADLKDTTPDIRPRASRPKATWTALDFLEDRRNWINTTIDELDQQRKTNSLKQLLDILQTNVYFLGTTGMEGITVTVLLDLRQKQQSGEDISSSLIRLKLEQDAFEHLSYIAELDKNSDTILKSEWTDLYSIITQRIKKYVMFEIWREEEERRNPQIPNAGITLSPDHFRLRAARLSGSELEWQPTPWRSSVEIRQKWEDTLRGRIDQEKAAIYGLQPAVSAVEEALFVELRNELIRTWALPGLITPEKLAALTQRLQIDCQAGACQMTTRIAQAIETIQGVLFGARNGLLEDNTLTLDADNFDEEWKWIGSYATWRAAMQVFLYPENVLRPTLRKRQSSGFETLATDLRNLGRITPDSITPFVEKFQNYFRDIASLSFAGLCQTSDLLPTLSSTTPPELGIPFWYDIGDVFAVGQGGASGGYYFSVWPRRSGWGLSGSPEQTEWRMIQKLPHRSELIGLLPYQDAPDRVAIGLYFRVREEGVYRYHFADFAGSPECDAFPLGEFPLLVRTAHYVHGNVPSSPRRISDGVSPWLLHPNDQFCAADVDGNGRQEIIVLSGRLEANGSRRIGLLREFGGGLALDQERFWPGGWRLPDSKRPVYLQSGALTRVLVVDAAGTQIAAIGWHNGSLELMNATSQVQGAGGNWQVNLGAPDRPTTFIKARIDSGNPKVLVFEYRDGDGTGIGDISYGQTATFVTVLEWANNRFERLTGSMELKHHTAAVPRLGGIYSVKWERFVTIPRDFGRQGALGHTEDDILMLTKRNEEVRESGSGGIDSLKPKPFMYLRLYSWNGVSFDAPPLIQESATFKEVKPLQEGSEAWILDEADYFITVERPSAKKISGFPYMQELVIVSPARKSLGVITKTDDGLRVAWQGQDHLESAIPLGTGWEISSADYLLPVDMDGDDRQEILIVNPEAGRIGVLVLGSDFSLKVRSVIEPKVQQPSAKSSEGWLLRSTIQLFPADLDGDRYQEMVAVAVEGNYSRLGILRSVPGSRPRHLQGLPTRFGPIDATALNIYERLSDSQLAKRKKQIEDTYKANILYEGLGKPALNPRGNLIFIAQNITYLDEAYYFAPMEIALRLRESGYYTEALDWLRSIYDYNKSPDKRKIAYKLVLDAGEPDFTRKHDWLRDPLNPHAIAETRKNSYNKFTILAIVRCLLDYADAEFTRATVESVPRARELYLEALDLLDLPEIKQHLTECSDLIGKLDIKVGSDEEIWVWHQIQLELVKVNDYQKLAAAVDKLQPILASDEDLPVRAAAAYKIIADTQDESAEASTFEMAIDHNKEAMRRNYSTVLTDTTTARSVQYLGNEAFTMYDSKAHGWGERIHLPAPLLPFCIPPNRVIQAARSHAELNLRKIRACRNIAGMELRLDLYAAPTAAEASLQTLGSGDQSPSLNSQGFQPLPYRYAILIERTKQIVDLARQMENSMLSFITSVEQAKYEEIKARQDLALAQAGVRLKDLQLSQATDGITSAELQRGRAQIQRRHYNKLLADGWTLNEHLGIGALYIAAGLHATAAGFSFFDAGLKFWESPQKVASGLSSLAAASSTMSQVFSNYANYERREQDWRFQRQLSDQDVRIGQQQIRLAQDQVFVVAQERAISALQVDHAEAILDFIITKKFTNHDLYEWMSGVLEQVYRFFLQQATSLAQLAERQLAFERQEIPPKFIQADYWEPPSQGLSPDFSPQSVSGQTTNLRGLTGSARLLRDIYELDQYAFLKNQRKLQLTETISLVKLDPFAFQRFRETGALPFATPMSLFDRKFPGHYVRLIKRVRTSVIALIPPAQGIRATLSTIGTSRVVIGHSTFENAVIQRSPESVALTSPINAAGLFELDPQPELLVPFEGIGVDTTWEFRLPKAANQLDYNTIADILITIEYTALHSYDYQQQVLQTVDRRFSADRAFSFRNEFADQWYDLHNPELLEESQQMAVRFRTEREDFPPNLEGLSIQHVVLYFASQDGQNVPIENVNLQYTPETPNPAGNLATVGGDAKPIDGKISTRANAWNGISGQLLPGEWGISLRPADTDPQKTQKLEKIKEWFKSEKKGEKCEDILLVISYSGLTPEWPS